MHNRARSDQLRSRSTELCAPHVSTPRLEEFWNRINHQLSPLVVEESNSGRCIPNKGPRAPTSPTHTNIKRLADAPFGLIGNDNGRRYEAPPHSRVLMISAFISGLLRPSKSRALPTSKATIYLDDVCRYKRSPRSLDRDNSVFSQISCCRWPILIIQSMHVAPTCPVMIPVLSVLKTAVY